MKKVDAILWRKYLAATSHAVWKVSTSQYYFELPVGEFQKFFAGNYTPTVDPEGNDNFTIVLEPFDGEPGVGSHEVTFVRKRPGSAREGKWTVDSIRDGAKKAYALWHRNRGPLSRYENLSDNEKEKNYIVIVRDVDGRFHGRWIRGTDFDALPTMVQNILSSSPAGWSKL
ncbi:MAG: hypothetical protein IT582_02585 [Opitutaceae bacterium]|nr:hypothetical protein [Opitutaceae bacterium]